MKLRIALFLFCGFGLATAARAEAVLAGIFTDHAVLQRGQTVPIWGEAAPGEPVTVSYRTTTATTTAGPDGRWRVELPALQPGEPGDLVVVASNRLVRRDVVVGDVWICSGQSNMAFNVRRAAHADAEMAAAHHPQIRHFLTPFSAADAPAVAVEGTWEVCGPDTVGAFTAIGYFFARALQPEVGVPIGIINSSVGGTPIEAWMPEPVLSSFPDAVEATRAEASKAKSAARAKNAPSVLFNGMIAPLVPCAVRGFLWYQGEANTRSAERAVRYADLFKALITSWREAFGQGDLPFYFVQLPNFKTAEPESGRWPLLRESQAKALELPATGMAVTIDIGDPDDIHPTNKQEVGRRLALIAKRAMGGGGSAEAGPAFVAARRAGRTLRVEFDQPLRLQAEEAGMFSVAGEEGIFEPAGVRVEGRVLLLSHPAMAKPLLARYAWANNPSAALFNDAGLPAAPFRVDLRERAAVTR